MQGQGWTNVTVVTAVLCHPVPSAHPAPGRALGECKGSPLSCHECREGHPSPTRNQLGDLGGGSPPCASVSSSRKWGDDGTPPMAVGKIHPKCLEQRQACNWCIGCIGCCYYCYLSCSDSFCRSIGQYTTLIPAPGPLPLQTPSAGTPLPQVVALWLPFTWQTVLSDRAPRSLSALLS